MRLTAIWFLVLTAGCAAEQRRIASLDNGRTMIGGAPMIAETPIRVDCQCSDIPCEDLVQAASWWNSQVYDRTRRGPVVLVQAGASNQGARGCFIESDLPPGVLSVEEGLWTGSRLQGTWYARIQRGRARQGIIRHAMGHAMGLDDDPPRSVTRDLNSIMQSDAPQDGTVTAGDAVLAVARHRAPRKRRAQLQ